MAISAPFPLFVTSTVTKIGMPGVRDVGESTSAIDKSCNELTLRPCQELPMISSPERKDSALGEMIGPESSACAFIGEVTLAVNEDEEPGEIANSGEFSNSTVQPVISV